MGGGLAGLASAYHLVRQGAQVTVLEQGLRCGGQVHTDLDGSFVIDYGAEGYATGSGAVMELCTQLQLTGRLVSQLQTDSLVWQEGKLLRVPQREAARLAGIQANRPDFGQGISSFVGGMGELVEALTTALRPDADLRTLNPVSDVTRQADGWRLAVGTGSVQADQLVLAVPPGPAAELLGPLSRTAAQILEGLRAISSVTVSLAWPRTAVAHPLDAGGFIAAGGPAKAGVRACTFVSSKFPGRAPEGYALVRVFCRPGRRIPIEAPDERWVTLAVETLGPVLGVSQPPSRVWVARWPEALTRYRSDHDRRMVALVQTLDGLGPIALAGAAYRRAGVAGAVESAHDAAQRLLTRAPSRPSRDRRLQL